MANRDRTLFTITSSGTETYIDSCLVIGRELKGDFTEDAVTTLSQEVKTDG